jgi:predicted nucleic acid-binding protein
MLIYLDMCCLQRPCDDMAQVRIRVEAEAVLGILAFCDAGEAGLISSDPLEYEMSRNPYPLRRAYAQAALVRAVTVVRLSAPIEARAGQLAAAGLAPLDALHLSCAVEAGADYFCTCDDRLLRRGRAAQSAPPKIVSPLELVMELGL